MAINTVTAGKPPLRCCIWDFAGPQTQLQLPLRPALGWICSATVHNHRSSAGHRYEATLHNHQSGQSGEQAAFVGKTLSPLISRDEVKQSGQLNGCQRLQSCAHCY